MTLSVIMPVFNERATLAAILSMVCGALPEVRKEIIVVDDGSTDGSSEWLRANFPDGPRSGRHAAIGHDERFEFHDRSGVALTTIMPLYHERNRGKGACLKTGFLVAQGDVIVIQDADLEYNPGDWSAMYDLIATRKIADVVYGSRFANDGRRSFALLQYIGNIFISAFFRVLYGHKMSDVETCYKMFSRDVKDNLRLACDDFACEIEISAQIVRAQRWRIREVGISYSRRGVAEGKKLDWTDGVKALWYVLRFRIAA